MRASSRSKSKIVFIDARVSDVEVLRAGLVPGVRAHLLDPARDGLDQIAEFLRAEPAGSLTALSIVAHGAPGRLEIGPDGLTEGGLAQHADALSIIAAALAPRSIVQLYSCNVAQGAAGNRFVDAFSNSLGGAGVAASSRVVGAPSTGGSWALEAENVNRLSTPFVAETLVSYVGAFAAPTVSNLTQPLNINEDAAATNLFTAAPAVDDTDTPDDTITATLTLSNNLAGVLTGANAGVPGANSTVVYTITGTDAQVQTALQGVKFDSANDFNGTANVAITISDGTPANNQTGSVSINVAAVNDAPELSGDNQITVVRGGTATVTTADLSATDVDTGQNLTYTVTAATRGQVFANNTLVNVGQTFTQTQLVSGLVRFEQDGSINTNASFSVTVKDNGSPVESDSTTVTATVDLTPPSIAISPASITQQEGDGATLYSYTVTRSGNTNLASTVTYGVNGGGVGGAAAANASDFSGGRLPSGTIAFAAGVTSQQLVISVAGDQATEANEGFTVKLTGQTFATVPLATSTATGLIVNDDAGPTENADKLYGSDNADLVRLLEGNDTFRGGDGNDRAYGDEGNDAVYGDDGADTLRGGAGNDRVTGGDGNDAVYGDEGRDLLYGNDGADTLRGGADNDRLTGGNDNDRLYGDEGNDRLYGNDGRDYLDGGDGNDYLSGGEGADTLIGGGGGNRLIGGDGADRYVFSPDPTSRDLVQGFDQQGGDRLDLRGQSFDIRRAGDGDVVLDLSGGGTVRLDGVTEQEFGDGAGFFVK